MKMRKKLFISFVLMVLLLFWVVACSKQRSVTKANSISGAEVSTFVQPEIKPEEKENLVSFVKEEYEAKDEFGDVIGRTFFVKTGYDRSGTFSSADGKVKDAPLKWSLSVYENGFACFELKERGIESDIVELSGDSFLDLGVLLNTSISLKFSDHTEKLNAVVSMNEEEGVRNCVVFYNNHGYERNDFSAWKNFSHPGETVKIVLKTNNATYNLGSVNCDEFMEVYFPWFADYQRAEQLLEAGEYEEALEVFNALPKDRFVEIRAVFGVDMEKRIEDCKAEILKKEQKELLEQYLKGNNSVSLGVGWPGPAGGYIFYDCDADNESGNADGLKSSECGWRYLEAAPEDLPEEYVWGDDEDFGTKTGIGEGRNNTNIIVNKASNKRKDNAAMACVVYAGGGYSDWFLPSKDELKLMYQNLKENGIGNFPNGWDGCLYWSGSEYSTGYAWIQSFRYGDQDGYSRGNAHYVRPIRAFK